MGGGAGGGRDESETVKVKRHPEELLCDEYYLLKLHFLSYIYYL